VVRSSPNPGGHFVIRERHRGHTADGNAPYQTNRKETPGAQEEQA
jgi:hypothetical protein